MKLKFLGATGTVTGSKYAIETGEGIVLVDTGLFQGRKNLRTKNWETLPIDISKVSSVVLTHAHIDHSGYLPRLIKEGFKGKVYATPATRDLCRIMLPDCGHLMEEEAEYLNRRKRSKHTPALPLFTAKDGKEALKRFVPIQYGETCEIGGGLSFIFRDAGHILGSAHVTLFGESKSITFSGDIGRYGSTMMNDPDPPSVSDYVVMESTYGNRSHSNSNVEDELKNIINRTIKRGGTIIVPAFAVGRAQLLLHHVSELIKKKEIVKFPIYLNSPMATSVTDIYCEHKYNHKLSVQECKEMCDVAEYVNTPEDSKALNNSPWPKLIVSASGMATGGRVIHHIKAYGPDPKNTLLFAGYQASGTRGEKIVNGAKSVRIHGQEVTIGAEACDLSNLSAHADKFELLKWAKSFEASPKVAYITHGEQNVSMELRETIEKEVGWRCEVPQYLQEVDL